MKTKEEIEYDKAEAESMSIERFVHLNDEGAREAFNILYKGLEDTANIK